MKGVVGDKVQVGSRIGAAMAVAVVVDILPGLADRPAMYRVRFENQTNECWVDEGMIYPYHH